jgi:hypothetical protein
MKYCPCDDSVPRSLGSFETRFDGSTKQVFMIGAWPERMCFAREFLEQSNPVLVRVGENIVTIICTNARASYGLDSENFECNTVCVKSAEPREDEDDEG